MTSKVVTFSANSSWYLFNFRKNTLRLFIQEGYIVHVLAPDDKYFDLLSSFGCNCKIIALSPRSKNPLRELMSLFSIYKGLNSSGKIVFNFTPKINIYLSLIASIRGQFAINNISGLGRVFNKRGLLSSIVLILYRFINKFTYFTFFQNEDNYKEFVNQGVISKKRASVLPGSGVDINAFSYHDLPNSKAINFLFCSRVLESKGVGLLVKACDHIVSKGLNINLTIAGPIDEDDNGCIDIKEIEKWKSSKHIKFVGEVEDSRILLKESDCVVLPSYYSEGTPKILLEAGAMGRVIITTDMPGCRDVVSNDNGFLVQPRSLESLTDALLKVCNSSKKDLSEMGKKSRILIEDRFNEKIVLEQYLMKANEIFEMIDK
jgi:glycosyltransferase involved in cell wall biosynthesis